MPPVAERTIGVKVEILITHFSTNQIVYPLRNACVGFPAPPLLCSKLSYVWTCATDLTIDSMVFCFILDLEIALAQKLQLNFFAQNPLMSLKLFSMQVFNAANI